MISGYPSLLRPASVLRRLVILAGIDAALFALIGSLGVNLTDEGLIQVWGAASRVARFRIATSSRQGLWGRPCSTSLS